MTDVEMVRSVLPAGWDTTDGDDLICPCGHVIEADGTCPNGCVSPLRRMGWV